MLTVGQHCLWGFLPEHTPLCGQAPSPYGLWVPRVRRGSSPAQASEGMASPTDLLFVGQAVSETRFQEKGSKAPPLGGGGSKDLGATFKNGTLPFLSVKCLSRVPYLILTTIKIRTRRTRK